MYPTCVSFKLCEFIPAECELTLDNYFGNSLWIFFWELLWTFGNLLWKFFWEVVKANIVLGWLQPYSFRAWNNNVNIAYKHLTFSNWSWVWLLAKALKVGLHFACIGIQHWNWNPGPGTENLFSEQVNINTWWSHLPLPLQMNIYCKYLDIIYVLVWFSTWTRHS